MRIACLTPLARLAVGAPAGLARVLQGAGPPSPASAGRGAPPKLSVEVATQFVDALLDDFDAAAAGRPARARLWALAAVTCAC